MYDISIDITERPDDKGPLPCSSTCLKALAIVDCYLPLAPSRLSPLLQSLPSLK